MLARKQEYDAAAPSVLSEIILPYAQTNADDVIFPMLAYVSNQESNRWLTWVGSDAPTKAQLKEFHINGKRLRLIHTHSDEETLWMTWEALNNGTSDFVVGSFLDSEKVRTKERSYLEQAASTGHARALLVKHAH